MVIGIIVHINLTFNCYLFQLLCILSSFQTLEICSNKTGLYCVQLGVLYMLPCRIFKASFQQVFLPQSKRTSKEILPIPMKFISIEPPLCFRKPFWNEAIVWLLSGTSTYFQFKYYPSQIISAKVDLIALRWKLLVLGYDPHHRPYSF